MTLRSLRRLPLAAALAAAVVQAAPASASEALVLGGGAGLIPMYGPRLKLLKETLELSPLEGMPCYEAFSDTRAAVGGAAPAFLSLGPLVYCGSPGKTLVRPQWRAVDSYHVAAATDSIEVLFGLPVRTRIDAPSAQIEIPGSANFKAYVDGQEVAASSLTWLYQDRAILPGGKNQKPRTLGYRFTAKLEGGREHTIQAAYDFDIEYYDGESEGLTYAKGSPPWAPRQTAVQAADQNYPSVGSLRRIPYFLTVRSFWPDSPRAHISVRVDLPKALPETLALSAAYKPSCIGRHLIAFELEPNSIREDLAVSYPQPWSGPSKLETAEDWSAWKKSLGGDGVRMTCDLNRRMIFDSGAPIQARLRSESCVVSCE